MGKNLQRLTTDYEGLLKRYSMEKNFYRRDYIPCYTGCVVI